VSEDERTVYIDEDGNEKSWAPGSRAPSNIGLQDDVLMLRCRVSAEGDIFGCTRLRGPRAAEDDTIAALKKRKVEPDLDDGRPIESSRIFLVRVSFLMQ
jgi:hypothetical protein